MEVSSLKIMECVANYSEGRDAVKIQKLCDVITECGECHLLHVDIGYSANRTVITFAGEPEAVTQSAFRSIQLASQLIDMSGHHGNHPRIGAMDVCPFVPALNMEMEEAVHWSKVLGKRVGEELNIPVFLYENSSIEHYRKNLATIRRGEYEGLAHKMENPLWSPDFGPNKPHPTAGATVIGARPFLIAFNVNLETKDVSLANLIATEIRQSGGKAEHKGKKYFFKGGLPSVKAIGWYVEEYGCTQVSMNLTDFRICGPDEAYVRCGEIAERYNINLLGSEIVGLTPKEALIATGYRLGLTFNRQSEAEFISTASDFLGLNSVKPFVPEKHIFEYVLEAKIKESSLKVDANP